MSPRPHDGGVELEPGFIASHGWGFSGVVSYDAGFKLHTTKKNTPRVAGIHIQGIDGGRRRSKGGSDVGGGDAVCSERKRIFCASRGAACDIALAHGEAIMLDASKG